jgi:hypothetical protein
VDASPRFCGVYLDTENASYSNLDDQARRIAVNIAKLPLIRIAP